MSLKIEYLALDEIKEYERNARVHSPEQIQQIANMINDCGFTNPILTNVEGEIIAGHGRLAAAHEVGLDKVPVIRLHNLTERQIKALRIADNQLALNATWDLDLLASELMDLSSEEFDLDILGFDEDFLNGLLDEGFNDEVIDGYGEGGIGGEDEPSDVPVVVGPYKFTVERRAWDKWETAMRAKVGFDKNDIQKEMLRRLNFD